MAGFGSFLLSNARLPAAMLGAPTKWLPIWTVPHLVYKAGNPSLPPAAINGGGFIPFASPPRGREMPLTMDYATPVSSAVGGGQEPARPNFLTALLDNQVSTGNGF